MAETRSRETIDKNLALVCNARAATHAHLRTVLESARLAALDAKRHIETYDARITELLDERLGS